MGEFTDDPNEEDASDPLNQLGAVVGVKRPKLPDRRLQKRRSKQAFWAGIYAGVIGLFCVIALYLEASGTLQSWFGAESSQTKTASSEIEHAESTLNQVELLLRADRSQDALKLLRQLQYETKDNPDLADAIDPQRLQNDLDACASADNVSQDNTTDVKKAGHDDAADVPMMFPHSDWQQHPIVGEDDLPKPPSDSVPMTPDQFAKSDAAVVAPASQQPESSIIQTTSHQKADTLGKAGWDCMLRNDANGAGKIFHQALQIEPDNDRSIVGLAALPQIYGRSDTAIEQLEGLKNSNHRWSADVNLARLYLLMNPLRAGTLIEDCLNANYGDREQLLNYLGAAIWIADQRRSDSPVVGQLSDAYEKYQGEISQSHPGQARWGSRWVSETEAQDKWGGYRECHDDLINCSVRVDHVQTDLAHLQQEYGDAKSRYDLDLYAAERHKQNMQAFEKEIDDCKHQLTDAQRNLTNAHAAYQKIEKPPFPRNIPLYMP